jgi:Ca2+-binding EF-hand superfamily protein
MRAAVCKRHEKDNIVNKTIFEENWSQIRSVITAKWSLMVEYDLNKVDKAEVKFDKFVTMLQVKYGYTRQEARDKIGMLWAEYEANNKIKV